MHMKTKKSHTHTRINIYANIHMYMQACALTGWDQECKKKKERVWERAVNEIYNHRHKTRGKEHGYNKTHHRHKKKFYTIRLTKEKKKHQ